MKQDDFIYVRIPNEEFKRFKAIAVVNNANPYWLIRNYIKLIIQRGYI